MTKHFIMLLAAAMSLNACADPKDYLVRCNYDRTCARAMADAKNDKIAEFIALGTVGLLVGAAAGAAASQPTPTYYTRPVNCTSYSYGNSVQTQCR